jgi:hypothetical protein
MGAVVSIPAGGALAGAVPLPPISAALRTALYYAEREEEVGFAPPPCAVTVVDEARTALVAHDLACRPAGVPVILRWLLDLNRTVSAPLEPDAFKARAHAVAEACADLPACLFTAETWRAAARELRFFPGAADLVRFFGPRKDEATRTLRALRRITAPPAPKDPPPKPLTAQERDEVVAAFRPRYAAAVAPARSPTQQMPAEPRRRAPALSPAALAAGYQAVADDPRLPPARRELARVRLAAILGRPAETPADTPAETSHLAGTSRVEAADDRPS